MELNIFVNTEEEGLFFSVKNGVLNPHPVKQIYLWVIES